MKNIMIIDDSEGDQFLCEHIIKTYDSSINVLTAYDGQEALKILSDIEQQPDVILLDINMPVMDGHEFLERYSTMHNQQSVVSMLSSSDNDKDKINSHAYKFVKMYIRKPLSISHLEEIERLKI